MPWAAAERADSAKTRFLAAASHDLRQPLQSLAIFFGILANQPLTERQRRFVGLMEASLESLSDLLGFLLDISRLDAGIVEPERQPVPLDELLERLGHE